VKTAITPLKLARYRDILKIAPGEPARPIHWDVDPSTACDHACRGCPYIYDGPIDPMLGVIRPEMAKDKRTLLDAATFARFVTEAKHAGCKAITFVGGGEPTLHPQFEWMMRKVAHEGIKFGVITHLGRKYKPAFFEQLAKATWVRVSVNAGTRETYLKHQGKDDFEQAMSNIETAAAAGCNVGMSFLVTNDNWREIGLAARTAHERGARYIQYKPIIEVGEPGATYAGLEVQIAERLRAVHGFYPREDFQILDQWSARIAELKQHHQRAFSGACHVPKFNPKLGANGIVYTCCELAYSDEAALGSIYDEPLEAILRRAASRCGQIDMAKCPQCWDKPVNTMINADQFDFVEPPAASVDQEFV
jgi:MoaA/NifB/PqqE/SkfB family radical SAM enzyme